MKHKGTLDRRKVPDNVIDRAEGLEYRVSRLERLVLTQEVAGTLFVPIETAIFSGARVYHSSATSIPNNTFTPLTFDSEFFDTDGYHDPGANPGRLTVPADGIYLIMAGIFWQANVTGIRAARIIHSAAPSFAMAWNNVPAGSTAVANNFSTIISMTAGQYVIIDVLQDSGGALNVQASAFDSPVFSIARLR